MEFKSYQLPPTALVPNSPRPLLHYPGFLSKKAGSSTVKVYDIFSSNGWKVQWIYQYGPTQRSHYHSSAHECMAVLSGTATIRFGVADTVADLDENTFGKGQEEGGVEVLAKKGDVFILPAGTAHKTFNTQPPAEFKLLSPGDGHSIPSVDVRAALAGVELDGFTMMGAYPADSVWDFAVGGENRGHYDKVWNVPKPENDPVLGKTATGLCGFWS